MQGHSDAWALVIDDNALIRMDAVNIVQKVGFRVLDAAVIDEALDLSNEHDSRLQLLFTDVHMPSAHDGFNLAREVSRCWPRIAITVAFGEATPGPTDMPPDATLIGKPFSEAGVHHTLRRTMPTEQQPGRLRQGFRPFRATAPRTVVVAWTAWSRRVASGEVS